MLERSENLTPSLTDPMQAIAEVDASIAQASLWPQAKTYGLAVSAGLSVAACGGGGGGGGGGGTTQVTTPINISKPTEQQAARFLMQASFGGNYTQIQEVQNKGFEAWLDAELNKPWIEAYSHYNWFKDHGYFDIQTKSRGEIGVDNTLWRKLITAPDVLRQRVAYALSQIFVVSMNGLGAMSWRNVGAICYMDLLEKMLSILTKLCSKP